MPPASGRPTTILKALDQQEPSMKREDLTEKLLDIKREKGWTWK